MYGPVPIGSLTRPSAFERYSLGAICSDENATFAGIAGSGAHNVRTNVFASVASSLATLLWLVSVPHDALSSYEIRSPPPAASVPAGSVPGGSVVADAVDPTVVATS